MADFWDWLTAAPMPGLITAADDAPNRFGMLSQGGVPWGSLAVPPHMQGATPSEMIRNAPDRLVPAPGQESMIWGTQGAYLHPNVLSLYLDMQRRPPPAGDEVLTRNAPVAIPWMPRVPAGTTERSQASGWPYRDWLDETNRSDQFDQWGARRM
jgi:hypothetical protein